MSSIKQLAGQTMWYGLSSIAARFINYLLTPYLTFKLTEAQYGEQSIIYAFIPFMNIIFTYGMETSFFRFSSNNDKGTIYSTTSISLIISTVCFSLMLMMLQGPLSALLMINNPEYLMLSAAIIGVDALSTIPFAKLRLDGKPRKFAFVKLLGIFINIFFVYFFISICPEWIKENPEHWVSSFYNPEWVIGYLLLANLFQSVITLLLLSKEFLGFRFQFNKKLWKEMMVYGAPLIIAGFAGMINETFDRIMLKWWAPVATREAANVEVGIYSACYKLSILITLGVQAFRMGAEPFFFKQSTQDNAQRTYARVMKFFVITVCIMFLSVVLYLDIWKHFIRNEKLWVGLKVVPILLLANMFLGIYYNLSIWYKLGNKTIAGAYITVIGAAITLLINYIFIPHFSYMACAWATFACYGSMMVVSFIWGQKNYYIPYAWKKLVAFIVIVVLLSFLHKGIVSLAQNFISSTIINYIINYGVATFLLFAFLWFISLVERKEIRKLPVIGKYFK